MDSIPPRFESLSSNFYQLIRNKNSKLFMCRCVRFLPAAASRFSITKSLPLFLLRSVRISENHRFYSLSVELIETIAVCQPWIRGSVWVDQNVYDQVLPQILPADVWHRFSSGWALWRGGGQSITDRMSHPPLAGSRFTFMGLFSGWIR